MGTASDFEEPTSHGPNPIPESGWLYPFLSSLASAFTMLADGTTGHSAELGALSATIFLYIASGARSISPGHATAP